MGRWEGFELTCTVTWNYLAVNVVQCLSCSRHGELWLGTVLLHAVHQALSRGSMPDDAAESVIATQLLLYLQWACLFAFLQETDGEELAKSPNSDGSQEDNLSSAHLGSPPSSTPSPVSSAPGDGKVW